MIPAITAAEFMSTAPTSLAGSSPWASRYSAEIRRVVFDHASQAPRTLQQHLGPSELGSVCPRQVAAKMAAMPTTNHVSDPWPSIMGTAGHAWIEGAFTADNVRTGTLRWITEQRVTPHPDHPGTADLYDAVEAVVCDHKFLAASTHAKIVKGGPISPTTGKPTIGPRHYRVQLCLDPATPVLMADMQWVPIGSLKPGDRVKAVDEERQPHRGGRNLRSWKDATVEAVWSVKKEAYEVELSDGTVLTASGSHRFLVNGDGGMQWQTVDRIAKRLKRANSGGVRVSRPYARRTVDGPDTSSDAYAAGYLTGAHLGDGWSTWDEARYVYQWSIIKGEHDHEFMDRLVAFAARFGVTLRRKVKAPTERGWQKRPCLVVTCTRKAEVASLLGLAAHEQTDEWKAGWLAGLYDTDGHRAKGFLNITQKDRSVLLQAQTYAKDLGFDWEIHEPNLLMMSGLVTERARFTAVIAAVIPRKQERLEGMTLRDGSDTRVVSVRAVGKQDLVDITTSAGTFIADGVVSHNCLYGLGYVLLGLPVRKVAIAAYPRTAASLDGMYVRDEDFTSDGYTLLPEPAALLAQVFQETKERKAYAEQLLAGQITLSDIPAVADDDTCFWCPIFRPEAASKPELRATSCAGPRRDRSQGAEGVTS